MGKKNKYKIAANEPKQQQKAQAGDAEPQKQECKEVLQQLANAPLQGDATQEAAALTKPSPGNQPSVAPQTPRATQASLQPCRVVPRGTFGIRGICETNCLRLNLDGMPNVAYHYDVNITPDTPKRLMHVAFKQFHDSYFNDIPIAFDGRRNAYTVRKLQHNFIESKVLVGTIEFQIVIKETEACEIDLGSLRTYYRDRVYEKPMRAMQVLEVVLAHPCQIRGVRVGRSYFIKPENLYDLKDGYEMWTGLYQTTIFGDSPFLNVDICHMPFPTASTVLDFMRKHISNVNFDKPLDPTALNTLRKFINGTIILYKPPSFFKTKSKVFKVHDVSDKSAETLSFTAADGNTFTVFEYYRVKGYKLRHPKLNCLHVGSRDKTNFLPLELCSIEAGQIQLKNIGQTQVQELVRLAASSTNDRKYKIMHMLKTFQHNKDALIQHFGIKIESNFIDVPTRMLASPILEYFSRVTITPRNGSWRLHDKCKFLVTSKMKQVPYKWALICSVKANLGYNQMERITAAIAKRARTLNVNLAENATIKKYDDIDAALRKYKDEKYDLVLVVWSQAGATYANIKKSAELKHGILTQCIREDTIHRRLDDQVIINLLLKINAKLNGTNHKIPDLSNVPLKNAMFLGADVTHPSLDQGQMPSIVGSAASYDINGACYNMQYRLQQAKKEDIEDMGSIIAYHLKFYFDRRGSYPDRIIYYRDGVSDGQFPIIKRVELGAIRAYCRRLRIAPKITCVVVVKRHHIRLFPKTVGTDKYNNVPPGTVVDEVIVHPNEVQFFLVSQQSPMGTARPTRYNVIENDGNLQIDLLQKVTYYLCHLFPRCNRVVSLPAPAYLAHLIAYRGRVYVEGEQNFSDLRSEYERRLINADFLRNNPMYFV